MIELTDIRKSFGDLTAIDRISLLIKEGHVFGLIGTNGAGKSTLLRIAAGVLRADGGQAVIDGKPVFDNPAVKSLLYFIADDPWYLPNSCAEDMRRYLFVIYPAFDDARFCVLMKDFGLDPKRRISTYSKGMKKQLAVILGICAGTKYLLCDETFDGLDPVVRQAVKSLLASDMEERGLTPVIASHNLRELEDICEHIGIAGTSALTFLLIFPATLLVSALVAAAMQAAGTELAKAMLLYLLKHTALFFATYSVSVLAVMLTGNIIVSALAAGVLLFFEPVLLITLRILGRMSFRTIDVRLLSEVGLVTPWMNALRYSILPAALHNAAIALLFFAVSYLCFRIRPSESAGQAVPFRGVRSLVKIAIAVLAALMVTIVFYEAPTCIPLAVLAAVIVCCVMEIIYAFDIRALFRHFPELIAACAISVFLIFSFKTDLFGFDRWVPRSSMVKDAAFLTSGYYTNHYDANGSYMRTSTSKYYEEHMHLTNIDALRYLAKICAEKEKADPDFRTYQYFTILWRLKGGLEVRRNYSLPSDIDPAVVDAVIGTDEYREGYYQIYHDDYLAAYRKPIRAFYTNGASVSGEKTIDYGAFREAYRKDLAQVDFSYLSSHPVSGIVSILAGKEISIKYEIYDDFAETIRVLTEAGIYLPDPLREGIDSVTVSLPDYSFQSDADPVFAGSIGLEGTADPHTRVYTDPKDIRAILEHAYNGTLSGPFLGCYTCEHYDPDVPEFDAQVALKDGSVFWIGFRNNEIPELLMDDFAEFIGR